MYNKNSTLSRRHVSIFIGSSSGPLKNTSKSYLYFNALWDLKCLQIMLQECKIYEFVYIRICVTVLALESKTLSEMYAKTSWVQKTV